MSNRTAFVRAALLLGVSLPLIGGGCKDDDSGNREEETSCTPGDASTCEEGQVCEEVIDGEPACFAPVHIAGHVLDTADGHPIEGARVVAQDVNGAAVSDIAVTDGEGAYTLTVPAPRQADGTIVEDTLYTLRADAAAYLTFPYPPRQAIPVDLSTAEADDLLVENASTEVALIALPDPSNLGTIRGRVTGEDPRGTFVVAGGASAIADEDGTFEIFNVPAGEVIVQGYRLGLNLVPVSVDVEAGSILEDVELAPAGGATAVVSGSINLVNPGDGDLTSVILVVAETFDDVTITGEAPPGFRVGEVQNDWSLAGVPDGEYVVLAAFENDDLVRDPDTSIGGTEIQRITVAGEDVSVEAFKITGALAVISPGADGAEAVTAPVVLTWEDDSSEDFYEVRVFDAFGELKWETTATDPGGSKPVTATFEGPLDAGMYYQFRITSIKDDVPISTTEDLKGVFYAEGG